MKITASKARTILFAVFWVLVPTLLCLAQPENIDISSLVLTREGVHGQDHFRMDAVVITSQEPRSYIDDDSHFINFTPEYLFCEPCSPPKLFDTNFYRSEMHVQLGSQSGVVMDFYFTSILSPPAWLGQRVLSRKTDFILAGPVRLIGHVEIRDVSSPTPRLLAYDDDVDLRGRYSMTFYKPYRSSSDGTLLTDFRRFALNLTDDR